MIYKRMQINSVKIIMISLLLCIFMFSAAIAEDLSDMQTPTENENKVEMVEDEGSQLHTGPVLMVTKYNIIEGETVPGSSFVLEMEIANLSETAPAYNVLVTLTIENISVSLQQTVTNQRYFHEIPPNQTVTAQFPMEVYSYCKEENMILSMTMTCYDSAAVHYDFQTMMTPDVDIVRSLMVGSLNVPQFVHRNSSMIISASLTNAEAVTLDNIKMHVITQYGEQISEVGQLLTGESKTTNCIYRFPEQKNETVEVYFTYESLSGHLYTTDHKKFEVVVYDPVAENERSGDNPSTVVDTLKQLLKKIEVPGTDFALPVPVFVLIMIGLAGYVVVLYTVLRRKRK